MKDWPYGLLSAFSHMEGTSTYYMALEVLSSAARAALFVINVKGYRSLA